MLCEARKHERYGFEAVMLQMPMLCNGTNFLQSVCNRVITSQKRRVNVHDMCANSCWQFRDTRLLMIEQT